MKKRIHTILATMLLSFLLGCHDCPPCQKDVNITDCMRNSIPYQIGDTIRFQSEEEDTITFVCTSRDTFKLEHFPSGLQESDCCKPYRSDNISSKLTGDKGSISINTDNGGPNYSLVVRLNLNDFNRDASFYDIDCYMRLDSVTIAQQTLHEVIAMRCFPNADTLYFRNTSSPLGLIGFKVDGVEWAKID